MPGQAFDQLLAPQPEGDLPGYELVDGSKVAVIGGGPAGSFFSYFLLEMAERMGTDIQVDIYEPRDFSRPGPSGCNMCGGIISESLVQTLATDGINLPPTVVQRGIDSYILHMDVGSARIDTPLYEKRIGAVHRGTGPLGIKEIKWDSFDGHLQSLAADKGANIICSRVSKVSLNNGRPQISTREDQPQDYDLLVVSVGVNSAALKLFKGIEIAYEPPRTTKTFIREYYLGQETIEKQMGSSMHVFLLDISRIEFAAIVPKGDYVSLCLLGEKIDNNLIKTFLDAPEVRNCFPADFPMEQGVCQCSPRISIKGAAQPFSDRIVFIGDAGVTRLYKDGIGAAYRTAKAAATTAMFQGISTEDFRQYYWPACQRISTDNKIGRLVFFITRQIQRRRFARRAILRMVTDEQNMEAKSRRMSMVLWDTFTGSAPYQQIFMSTLHPAFMGRFIWDIVVSLSGKR